MAVQDNSRIETTPVSISNPAGVINANWQQVEKVLDPDNTVHDYDGTADDVGNLIRNNLFRDGKVTLTDDGSVELDFDAKPVQQLSATQNTTFTFANAAAGKIIHLILVNDSTSHSVTWPAAAHITGSSGTELNVNEEAYIQILALSASDVRVVWPRNAAIPSSTVEYGILSVEGNATATTISAASSDFTNKVQFVGFDTNGASSANVTPDHTNDHITVDEDGLYRIVCQVSLSGGNNDTISMALFKNNGATKLGTRATNTMDASGNVTLVAISAVVTLAATDTVELWLQNETDTSSVTIQDCEMDIEAL